MTPTSRLRVVVAPALLVAVAVTQVVLATAGDLSPWRGGGFGMFASVDRVEHRAVRAQVASDADGAAAPVGDADVDAFADLSFADEQLVERVRARPDDAAVSRLAQALSRTGWARGDGGALVPTSDGPDATPPVCVRVEVWRTTFDAGADRADPRRLADTTAGCPR